MYWIPQNNATLKSGQGSFKVIDTPAYDFLGYYSSFVSKCTTFRIFVFENIGYTVTLKPGLAAIQDRCK